MSADASPEVSMNESMDTLEIILNPALIKPKVYYFIAGYQFKVLDEYQQQVQGKKLLQDLLSTTRFGTPTLVEAGAATPVSQEDGGQQQSTPTQQTQPQTMRLSERQDMLLSQACKVYYQASLTLDDILEVVPQPNQLCLLSAMMVLSQSSSPPDSKALVRQDVPWDPITTFQRWVLRTRLTDAPLPVLDLGDPAVHAKALRRKLDTLEANDPKDTGCIQCRLGAELGEYYCWNRQYKEGLDFLQKSLEKHSQHPSVKCRLDTARVEVVIRLAKTGAGLPTSDAPNQKMAELVALERRGQYSQLLEAFKEDNIHRQLPFTWRQSVVWRASQGRDMRGATLLAILNATYNQNDADRMMLELPRPVLRYLRSIPTKPDFEAESYLGTTIFDDIMAIIKAVKTSGPKSAEAVKEFALKICRTTGHILAFEAAWTAGVFEPNVQDWIFVWEMYSAIKARDKCSEVSNDSDDNSEDTTDHDTESNLEEDGTPLGEMLESMNLADLDTYLRAKPLSPLACSLVTLAYGAQLCESGQYLRAVNYLQATASFLSEVMDTTSSPFPQVEFQLSKYTAISHLGIVVTRTERKLEERHQRQLMASVNRRRQQQQQQHVAGGATADAEGANSGNAVDLEQEEAEISENTIEVCGLLTEYLTSYGALELELQARCLALFIDGRLWDFIQGYCGAAINVLNPNIYGELLQLYNVLNPFVEVLSKAEKLGVELRDITTKKCLDTLVSTDLNPINATKVAAYNMIQGLLVNVRKPRNPPPQQQQQQQLQDQPPPPVFDEDIGHQAILRVLRRVRTRGVADVFGAIVAGALSSIQPDVTKLTLRGFGYFALFSTSMDSVSSWTDPRVKIIAMLSSGDAGRLIDNSPFPATPHRLLQFLIQLYEDQIQKTTDSLVSAANLSGGTGASGETGDGGKFPLLTSVHNARHSLCLADLYHLDHRPRESLGYFLCACMNASRGFTEMDRLERYIWTVDPSGGGNPTLRAPSPSASPFPGNADADYDRGGLSDLPYKSLSALTAMNDPGSDAAAATTIGLGLSPSNTTAPSESSASPGSANGPNAAATSAVQGGTTPSVPSQAVPPPAAPLLPSSFALRAIDNCVRIREPLASVVMQQFLPRIQYQQAHQSLTAAGEFGLLTLSSMSQSTPSIPSTQSVAGGPVEPPLPSMGGANDSASMGIGYLDLLFDPALLEVAYYLLSQQLQQLQRQRQQQQQQQQQQPQPQGVLGSAFGADMSGLGSVGAVSPRQRVLEETMNRIVSLLGNNRLALDTRPILRDQHKTFVERELLLRLWTVYAPRKIRRL
ncbi:hypothetical protein BGW41_001883 [Actinomortierella wolfii]|nr:hypothetical protein BGW41_001883 [Actinomortierella wolfii]